MDSSMYEIYKRQEALMSFTCEALADHDKGISDLSKKTSSLGKSLKKLNKKSTWVLLFGIGCTAMCFKLLSDEIKELNGELKACKEQIKDLSDNKNYDISFTEEEGWSHDN